MPLYANRQKGLALITVLFIFALVSLLAVSMQKRQVMSMAQASATFNRTQAMLLAVSAEDVAKAFLKLDGKRDKDEGQEWDGAVELWNNPVTMELSGAEVFINIRDLQGLFNLNSLSPGDNANAARQRFERLLNNLSLPASASPTDIALQTKEWLDTDSSASNTYQNLTPSYSASGMAFSHPSELLLLEGVDRETYLLIEPYVTALPKTAALNINTTHEHILQAWDLKLTLEEAKTVVEKARAGSCGLKVRNDNIFQSTNDFWAHDNIKELVDPAKDKNKHWNQEDFDVYSQYFSVFIMIKINENSDSTQLILESIIKREKDDFIGVVYRDFSRKIEDITTRLKIINC
mgnify:CR=1 FL=1